MKVARFSVEGDIRYGIIREDKVYGVEDDIFSGLKETGASWGLDKVKLLAPVVPGKALAVGLNYKDHIEEMGHETPSVPTIFLKPGSSLQNPEDSVEYPHGVSKQVDHESELVVVIGKKAKGISEAEALDCVFGYTCGNDVTARDLQPLSSQFGFCKGFDTFMPIGPWMETELDPGNLDIRALVNGKARQSSNTKHLLFTVPCLISYLSQGMTLMPGDIIFTGTSSGVGPVVPGDVMEIEIQGIGTLRNPVA